MRKAILTIIIIGTTISLNAQNWMGIRSSKPVKPAVNLTHSNFPETGLQINVDGYSYTSVNINGVSAIKLHLPTGARNLVKGIPDLPALTTSLLVPPNTAMKVEIVQQHFIELQNIIIAPSKGNLLRNQKPSEVPWEFGEVYQKNEFYPATIASLDPAYIFRDFHGQTLRFTPFQYNPVTKVLRVYYAVTLVIKPVKPLSEPYSPPASIPADFASVYERHFINYNSLQAKYTPLAETGSMLIISHANFMQAMKPLVDWRNMTGTPTVILPLDSVGNTPAAIKSFVSNYYDTKSLTHLLLVGDAQFIPTNSLSQGHSDNAYGYLTGNDSYPEIFVGRFSTETNAHVATMVQRTIDYEKSPQFQTNWLNKATGIASDEGPGDDNEMDWEHVRYMLNDMLAYTYSYGYEFYEGSQGGTDAPGNPTSTMLATAINNGTGAILYTGHGSSTSFSTTGFNNSNINSLTNTGMLPFIISVACVNGDFVGKTCFAETWLRATSSTGQPTGGVAALMSTINQTWNPPMAGQDEMVDILTETYQNNIKRTFGGISMNGCMKMNDKYGNAGAEMTDTWTIFGDPALTIRTDTPKVIIATHPANLISGAGQLQISSTTTGAKATISKQGLFLGSAHLIAGSANIQIPAPLSPGDTLTLVVTAFNHIPYIAHIPIIQTSGPYVVVKSVTINDPLGNNNGLADYGETISLSIELENIGVDSSNTLSVILSSTSPYIAITDSTDIAGVVYAGTIKTRSSAFGLTVNPIIPDQHNAQLSFLVTDNQNNTWTSTASITLNAPILSATTFLIIDSINGNNNGRLEPGETALVRIIASNTGHAPATAGQASLTSSSSFLSVLQNTTSCPQLSVTGTAALSFMVQASPAIPIGTSAILKFTIDAGDYGTQNEFIVTIGENVEDWETNSFAKYNWINDAFKPWTVVSNGAYEGSFASRSGLTAADNGKTSQLRINIITLQDDSISFFHKVSSETGYGTWYDYLEFMVNNQSMGRWDGITNWQRASYKLNKGTNSLVWKYVKDNYVSAGQDCAWIDFIKLPPMASPAGLQTNSPENSMLVFPSPATDVITIMLPAASKQQEVIRIYNQQGQLVKSFSVGMEETMHLDISSLPQGVYFIRLSSGNTIIQSVFVKI